MEDNDRKGIILAGGKGTRLSPITFGVSKQLLPLYNKPAIYYPLSTLMLSGIRKILIIVNPKDLNNFHSLLGNGEQFGIEISYAEQSSPDGIAQAFTIGEKFIGDSNVTLILGDNFFYGNSLSKDLLKASKKNKGATIFACEVKDPERYGVVDFDEDLKIKSITEKPRDPLTNFAVTGLYFYDNNVIEYSKKLKPSKRGELEITDLNMIYLKKGELEVNLFARAIQLADDICKCSPLAIKEVIKNSRLAQINPLKAINNFNRVQNKLIKSNDFLEGLKSFEEKRPPKFKI